MGIILGLVGSFIIGMASRHIVLTLVGITLLSIGNAMQAGGQ
jgi:hypothetical protein